LQKLQGLTRKVQQQNKLVRFFQDMGKKAVPFELGDFAQVRRVHFDPEHHMSVLFQMHGSVWPSVFPFCCANVLIALGVMYLRTHQDMDLTFPSTGHTFMSIMVSFLVVTRNSITYARFMAAGEHLSTSYRTCRELMQHVCVLTMHDTSPGAQKWRQNVAYRTILLLRVTMAAIEVRSFLSPNLFIPSHHTFILLFLTIHSISFFVSGTKYNMYYIIYSLIVRMWTRGTWFRMGV
jgi:hypothetical protein